MPPTTPDELHATMDPPLTPHDPGPNTPGPISWMTDPSAANDPLFTDPGSDSAGGPWSATAEPHGQVMPPTTPDELHATMDPPLTPHDPGPNTPGPISWMTDPSAANDPLFTDPGSDSAGGPWSATAEPHGQVMPPTTPDELHATMDPPLTPHDPGPNTPGPISWMTDPSAANDPLFTDPGSDTGPNTPGLTSWMTDPSAANDPLFTDPGSDTGPNTAGLTSWMTDPSAANDPLFTDPGSDTTTDPSSPGYNQGDAFQPTYFDANSNEYFTLDGAGNATTVDPSQITDFSQVQSASDLNPQDVNVGDTGITVGDDGGTDTAGVTSWMTDPSAANDPLFGDPGPTDPDVPPPTDNTPGTTDTPPGPTDPDNTPVTTTSTNADGTTSTTSTTTAHHHRQHPQHPRQQRRRRRLQRRRRRRQRW